MNKPLSVFVEKQIKFKKMLLRSLHSTFMRDGYAHGSITINFNSDYNHITNVNISEIEEPLINEFHDHIFNPVKDILTELKNDIASNSLRAEEIPSILQSIIKNI
jgi:hypothetical protein